MSRPDMEFIYARYRSKVLGYIRNRVNSPADAEDLCEDVFEKVQLKLDSYDSEKAQLSTWIYTITRNRVIDFYRRSHPHEELDEEMPSAEGVDDEMLSSETLKELAAALSKLPDEARDIIVFRYYDNKPLTEIAKLMNLSYGAVKLRHQSALEALRRAMQ